MNTRCSSIYQNNLFLINSVNRKFSSCPRYLRGKDAEFPQPLLLYGPFILEAQKMEFSLARMSRSHKFNQNKNVVNFTLPLHCHSAVLRKKGKRDRWCSYYKCKFLLHPWQEGRLWSKITSRVIKQNTATQ